MKRVYLSALIILCMVFTIFPTSAFAHQWTDESTITEDWYYLRAMNNYLNIADDGTAELRKLSKNEAYYVENVEGNFYTLKMKDGRYLGIAESDKRKNGTRVKAVDKPYAWAVYWETENANKVKRDIFSLRVPEAQKLLLNASGKNNSDGTHIILWSYESLNAQQHGEFRFIRADSKPDPTGESWVVYKKDGKYGYKDLRGKVVIKPQFNYAWPFSDGIAMVYSSAKKNAAFINTLGKRVTEYKYARNESSKEVSDGLIRVAIKSSKSPTGLKYGYINTSGKVVISPKYDHAYQFKNGRACVMDYQGKKASLNYHKVGYINKKGKLVVPYKYGGENAYVEEVLAYDDGFVPFVKYAGKSGIASNGAIKYMPVGIMDKNGKTVIPADPDKLYPSPFPTKWKDGIICNNYFLETDANGNPKKGGKHRWGFTEIYDYKGKLIGKLKGYREAQPLGGGYILARYQTQNKEGAFYWTLFDSKLNVIDDKLCKGDLNVMGGRGDNYFAGYANGYVFFAGKSYKVK